MPADLVLLQDTPLADR